MIFNVPDIHDKDIVDGTHLTAHNDKLWLSVIKVVVGWIVSVSKVWTGEDNLPGALAFTVEVLFVGKICVVNLVLSGVTEVLDSREVGEGHVGGGGRGLLSDVVVAVLVR